MAEFPLTTRLLHVLGVAVLLGGSAAVWGVLRRGGRVDAALSLAARYEWLFWGVVAVVVVTGVGNVGAFRGAVPGPGTDWGRTLAVKLGGVVGLLVGSLVRTAMVERCRELGGRSVGRTAVRRLRFGYGATALYLAALLLLAGVLAHG